MIYQNFLKKIEPEVKKNSYNNAYFAKHENVYAFVTLHNVLVKQTRNNQAIQQVNLRNSEVMY